MSTYQAPDYVANQRYSATLLRAAARAKQRVEVITNDGFGTRTVRGLCTYVDGTTATIWSGRKNHDLRCDQITSVAPIGRPRTGGNPFTQ